MVKNIDEATGTLTLNNGYTVKFFGAGEIYFIYELRSLVTEDFKEMITKLKDDVKKIVCISSEEDGSMTSLLNAGFIEIGSYGNSSSNRELKIFTYVQ